jgi:hypothetical protein
MKYRVTIPVYCTVVIEALDADDAFDKAVKQPNTLVWDRDDPQPDLNWDDCNIEEQDA